MRNHYHQWLRWLLCLTLTLALALLCATALADVVFDSNNFPDSDFRDFLKVNFNWTDGQRLDNDQLNRVTSLDCQSEGFNSLEGVEYFTALKTLYCGYNKLTILDVSSNTQLTELECFGNDLTLLDVGNCTKLKYLVCSDNQLTSLNISNCGQLESLECNNNRLSTLDISRCAIINKMAISLQPTDMGTYYAWEDNSTNTLYIDKNVTIITTENAPEEPETVAVTGITLNKTKGTLTRTGKQPKPTLRLTATVLPGDATDKSVTWSSDKPKIAKVDKNGKVTALAAGTATITCKANDGSGKSAKCVITVKDVKVTKIILNKTKATLKVGKTLQLKVKKFTPAYPLNTKVKWTTSNKKIAIVNKNGKVKAKQAGKVVITCASEDNKIVKAKCTITVK